MLTILIVGLWIAGGANAIAKKMRTRQALRT
jgi:hypothetical protein